MKQSNSESKPILAKGAKWLSRGALLGLASVMLYVISRPSYNYAHWIPHRELYNIGFSHASLLWVERNADSLLHFLGGFVLTLLIYSAKLPLMSTPRIRPFILVIMLCFAGELLQLLIGRGLQTSDLLLGILGGFMAYLSITKNN